MNPPSQAPPRWRPQTPSQAPPRWRPQKLAGWLGTGLGLGGWLVWGALGAGAALVAAGLGSALLAVGFFLSDKPGSPPVARADSPGDARREPPSDYESLLHSMSHDLRSPLGAVLNYAAILEEDYADVLDRDGLHMLSRVRSSAGNAMDRVDAVLELTRVARRQLEPAALDMAKLASQAASKVVDPAVRLDLQPLPEVRADRELMLQVWSELLANASEHCVGAKDPCIAVGGSLDGGEAVFTVTDNGEGFDMRYEAKLFRPFERLHAATESSGLGTGLAMAAAIVKRHGGWVDAEGALDEGATFRFAIPRSPELAS